MNLLLVDDEEYVIQSIQKNVKWEAVGITQIYTANSMKQAKNMMELVPIQIIISDIVMPYGSGFDFMNWVRGKNYLVQVIFLTSYAEFDYAQRAIALNSVDYLLKPIDYTKLSKSIQKAVLGVTKEKKYQDYYSDSMKWGRNKPLLQLNFFKELINGQMQKEAFDYGDSNHNFMLMHLQLQTQFGEENILSFIIGNVLGEMIAEYGYLIEAVYLEQPCSFLIISRENEAQNPDIPGIENTEVLMDFIKWGEEKLHTSIWCGASGKTKLKDLCNCRKRLRIMRENSLAVWNRVLYLEDFEKPEITYQNPNLPIWKALLTEYRTEELLRSIELYLDKIEEHEMITQDILRKFRMDVIQITYTWLAGREIMAHLLLDSGENDSLYQKTLEGVQGAKEFASYLIKKAIEYTTFIHQTKSVAEQLKQYIDLHYCEEIRRDELAELVYLNADYMSRIFKKEMGVSIRTYLLQKRVDEAKKLLTQSGLPINTVSIYVGYSNFSYFTKMFRENTGYSPLEYRRLLPPDEAND